MRNLLLVITILALPSAALLLFSGMIEPAQTASISHLQTPARAGSGQPNLQRSGTGDVFLSWIEPAGKGHALRFSRWTPGGWDSPRTAASGDNWFVNWADFPALTGVNQDFLAAHFLKVRGPRSYDYDIQLLLSQDGGETWSEPITPHRDGIPAEHGFVSYVPLDDRLGLVWLDGRHSGSGHGEGAMTLRYATIDQEGRLAQESELDHRVCDCCQTSVARTGDGLIVAYRDRSEGEIRDISVVRWINGAWAEPTRVHADQWMIPGCPVNGPVAVASGSKAAVAWYTQAEDVPQVRLAFSDDAGASFADPVRINQDETMGRVDAVMLNDGSVIVSWMEFVGEDGVSIRLRRAHRDGRLSPPVTIAETDSSRRSGFPHLARQGEDLLMAWLETGKQTRVASALIRVNQVLPTAE